MRDAPQHECGGCALDPDRREFLNRVGQSLAAVFLSLGIPSAVAEALAVGPALRLTEVGDERRYPVPTVDGAQIDRDAEVILVRWQNAVYAFALSCPHQNTALQWNDKSLRFQCTKHKSKYQPDGTFIDGRATRNMDRFTVARDGESIVVRLDALHQSDTERSAWSDAVVHLS
jgi:Rieske Fe-S protein